MKTHQIVNNITSIKRYSLGLSLLEATMVLAITASLLDVVNFAIFKAQQLTYDKNKSVYLTTVKSYVSDYVQQQKDRPFCDTQVSQGSCPRVKQVELSDIIDKQKFANLPSDFVKQTHVLLRIDSQNNNADVGYISALIFTESDSRQKTLDTARISTLVGPNAGMLGSDGDTISNGRNTFTISKKDWDSQLTSKMTEASNVLYLPSGLVKMVKKSIATPAVNLIGFDVVESGVAKSCINSFSCDWSPIYINDAIKLSWDKKNAATDHVKVKITTSNPGKVSTTFYSATFFNSTKASIPADDSWYNNTLQLEIIPYDIDDRPGTPITELFRATEPTINNFPMPFKISFGYLFFNIDNNNAQTNKSGMYKMLIPSYMSVENNDPSGEHSHSFIKPLTLIVTTNTVDGPLRTTHLSLYKKIIPDSRTHDYLNFQTDFNKLMADSSRYPLKLNNRKVYSIQTSIQLFWGGNVLREQVGVLNQFDQIDSEDLILH